jgi:hypothetical protein
VGKMCLFFKQVLRIRSGRVWLRKRSGRDFYVHCNELQVSVSGENFLNILQITVVNKVNLVHKFFLVSLSISTCFGRLCAHHQEKELSIPDRHPHRITCNKCRINKVVSPEDGHIVARNT